MVAFAASPSYSRAPSVKIKTGFSTSSARKVFGRPEQSRQLRVSNALSWDSSSKTFEGEVCPNSRKSARASFPALPQTCESAYCNFPRTDGIEVGITNFSFNMPSKASFNSSTLEGLFEMETRPSLLRPRSNTTPRISALRSNGKSFSSEYTSRTGTSFPLRMQE